MDWESLKYSRMLLWYGCVLSWPRRQVGKGSFPFVEIPAFLPLPPNRERNIRAWVQGAMGWACRALPWGIQQPGTSTELAPRNTPIPTTQMKNWTIPLRKNCLGLDLVSLSAVLANSQISASPTAPTILLYPLYQQWSLHYARDNPLCWLPEKTARHMRKKKGNEKNSSFLARQHQWGEEERIGLASKSHNGCCILVQSWNS